MGVFTFEDQNPSPLAPAKLFKALTKDSDDIIPKVIDVIQSIEIVEGNGGPGTVKKVTGVHGGKTSYVLQKTEVLDEANLEYHYSIERGNGLHETLEKVSFETKVFPGPNGGSIGKVTVKIHTRGNAPLSDAVRDELKTRAFGIFKATEAYVLANPDY